MICLGRFSITSITRRSFCSSNVHFVRYAFWSFFRAVDKLSLVFKSIHSNRRFAKNRYFLHLGKETLGYTWILNL